MNENSIYWMIAPAIIGLAVLLIGFVTSLKLPQEKRKNYIRKFAAVSLAIIFFCLPFSKPYVSFFSKATFVREQKAEILTSFEEITKYERDQTENIELLKEEVEKLREELDDVNAFYGDAIQTFSLVFALGFLFFTFRKEEKKSEEQDKNRY